MQISRWSWLRILLGGAVLFVLLERALLATSDILYLPSILLIGAFTVPVAFIALLYSRAKVPDVPWSTLGWCFLWGGVVGTVLAGRLEYETLKHLGTLPTIAIGVSEELAKIVVPLYLLWRWRYKSVFDGLIIGAATGAGFAALESMGYGLVALIASGGNINAAVETLLFRGLMAPAAHIAWTSLLCGALWYAKSHYGFKARRQLTNTLVGVILLHAIWDSVTSTAVLIALGSVSLLWLLLRVRQAERQGL
ncbi:MAG: protease PrsW [Candidatus Saccharibacteria bacterium]|nr:protease PrsW [Candidatus Saccharibacteria bacterium]